MKQIVGTAVLALMTASLSACGGGSQDDQQDVASTSETSSPETSPSADASAPSSTPSPSPRAPTSRSSRTTDVAPSQSARPKASSAAAAALRLNQTQRGRDLDTTVYEVRQPAKAPPYATLDTPGAIWVTVRAKQCLHRDAQRPHQADWTDYVGIDPDGLHHHAASSSWPAWPPKPQYPQGKKIAPGGCAVGWMLFGVTDKQQFSRIGLDDGRGSLVAQWTVR